MGEVRKTDTCGRRSWASAQAGGAGGHLEAGGAETSAALLPRLGARSSSRRSTEALHSFDHSRGASVSIRKDLLIPEY